MIRNEEIVERIRESLRVKTAMESQADLLRRMAEQWIECLRGAGRSSSSATAARPPTRSTWHASWPGASTRTAPASPLSLTVNSSTLTAVGNDFGYGQVFARQLEGLARPGDLAVGISTSGNSESVLAALRKARAMGLKTTGLTGRSGGAMPALADLCLRIDSEETPRIQEGHILAGHIIREMVEREVYP